MEIKEIVHSYFKNRLGVIATMHKKEEVVRPILEEFLGIETILAKDLNTDEYGTFTKDIERKGNQLEAARYKAIKAMELTGSSLAISSEGIFGPHPAVPFLPYNREIILLIDRENDLEIVGVSETTETNYGEKTVRDFNDAYEFAQKSGFPQHGMVIRSKEDFNKMFKGITTKEGLKKAILSILKDSPDQEVIIETDMRAMYNPTRMKNIESATKDLVSKIYSICPSCSSPGFVITANKKGLPCSWCGLPTELIISQIYSCKKCGEIKERPYPNAKEKADPGQCGFCNP